MILVEQYLNDISLFSNKMFASKKYNELKNAYFRYDLLKFQLFILLTF